MTEGDPKTSNLPLESADEQLIDKEKTDLVEYVRSDEAPSLPLGGGYLGDPSSLTRRTLPESAEQSVDKEKVDLAKYVRSLIKNMGLANMGYDGAEKFLQENNGLPSFIADEMMENGMGELVAKYFGKFKDLDQKKVIDDLITRGGGYDLIEHKGNFPELDCKELAFRLIETKQALAVCKSIDKFREWEEEIADKVMETKQYEALVKNICSFLKLDRPKKALELVEADEYEILFKYYEDFKIQDDNEMMTKIITKGGQWHVCEHLHKCRQKSLGKGVFKALAKSTDNIENLMVFLDKFHGLDKEDAMLLMRFENGVRVVEKNMSVFEGTDDEIKEIEAEKLRQSGTTTAPTEIKSNSEG